MSHSSLDLGLLAVLDTVSVAAFILYVYVFHISGFTLAILGYSMLIAASIAHLYVFWPEMLGIEGTWA